MKKTTNLEMKKKRDQRPYIAAAASCLWRVDITIMRNDVKRPERKTEVVREERR